MNLLKQQRIEYKFKLKREHDPEIRALIEKKIQNLEDQLKLSNRGQAKYERAKQQQTLL